MGRCGGRDLAHRKYTLNSSIPSKCQSFHGSRAYSIYSFAQLSWHSTGASELWMVNRGFLLFSYYPVQLSTQKTFNSELWMVRLWTSTFPILFSLNGPFSDSCKNELWTVDLGFLLLSWSIALYSFLLKNIGIQLVSCHFAFKVSFSDSCLRMNRLRKIGCGGRGREHRKYLRLIPASLQNVKVFSVESSRAYSDLSSFAHAVPWHSSLVPVNFAMVNRAHSYFSHIILYSFLLKRPSHSEGMLELSVSICGASTFPILHFYPSKRSLLRQLSENETLEAVDLGIPTFVMYLSPFEQLSAQRAMIMTKAWNPCHLQLSKFPSRTAVWEWTVWMGRCGG